ncbi:MAG: 1-deoxy-D-xylulose-5-phosphate reductoisomerase [Opitutales bacterium]
MSSPRNVVLLGATGSIGKNALRILRAHPKKLRLVGASAHSNAEALLSVAKEFNLARICLTDETARAEASKNLPQGTELLGGSSGLEELATMEEADVVLVAVVGVSGLSPTLAALRSGKDVALANKEALVAGGKFVMEAAQASGARILPTDSEHNAVFQCLGGGSAEQVDKIILTASGGPFRDWSTERMADATPEEALRHPNWAMGPKITVDSATMANKGLEIIEARWLFDLPPERIEVIVHPQSIVHSLVQFVDGSLVAQMSPPSMTFAIQHALLFPERAPGVDETINFAEAFSLDFTPPDPERFPCLRLAREALARGGVGPAVFNAANEVAVEAFLQNRIGFPSIAHTIEYSLERMKIQEPVDLADVFAADAEARRVAAERTNATQPTP